MRLLTHKDIIGSRIHRVFHVDLPIEKGSDFQPRHIVVELVSGIMFCLQQDHPICNNLSEPAHVLTTDMQMNSDPLFQQESCKDLDSQVTGVFLPYGWEDSFGLSLENGFALHDSFSMTDNGAQFYRPSPETLSEFIPITLPE